ncbi:phosphatase PAP2 family protein [Catenuloplanes japonicus]|uniref:phosphatase PAP2 family protein n=1 Tax=Catenuloplanes japonicus TaxID=33876 RepID=UPI000A68BEC4|nr:phosphatase PAP2 family protein [Catenuloplanes japonicus]
MRRLGWWFDVLLLAALAGLTALLAAGHLLDLDLAVSDWAFGFQPAVLHYPSYVANYLGQGGPFLALGGAMALWLAYRWRDVRPIILLAATQLFTIVVVTPIKELSSRDAPRSTLPNKAEIFNELAARGEYNWSYPSGHMVNTIVWYFTLYLLALWVFGERVRRWQTLIRVAPPIIVFWTTVYLNYHWLTDSIAGLLLGIVMGRVMALIPWRTLPLPSWVPFNPQQPSAGTGGAQPSQPADQQRVVG